MPRVKHPVHPHGTYYLHGDGRPRPVRILEIGTRDRKPGKVHIEDFKRNRYTGERYWIARETLSRSPKPQRLSQEARNARRSLARLSVLGAFD